MLIVDYLSKFVLKELRSQQEKVTWELETTRKKYTINYSVYKTKYQPRTLDERISTRKHKWKQIQRK